MFGNPRKVTTKVIKKTDFEPSNKLRLPIWEADNYLKTLLKGGYTIYDVVAEGGFGNLASKAAGKYVCVWKNGWSNTASLSSVGVEASNRNAQSIFLRSNSDIWIAYASGGNNVYAKRWNGSTWSAADTLSTYVGYTGAVTLDGHATATFCVYTDHSSSSKLRLKTHNGSAWTDNGLITSGAVITSPAVNRHAATTINGTDLIVAWMEGVHPNKTFYIKQWNGSTWTDLFSEVYTDEPFFDIKYHNSKLYLLWNNLLYEIAGGVKTLVHTYSETACSRASLDASGTLISATFSTLYCYLYDTATGTEAAKPIYTGTASEMFWSGTDLYIADQLQSKVWKYTPDGFRILFSNGSVGNNTVQIAVSGTSIWTMANNIVNRTVNAVADFSSSFTFQDTHLSPHTAVCVMGVVINEYNDVISHLETVLFQFYKYGGWDLNSKFTLAWGDWKIVGTDANAISKLKIEYSRLAFNGVYTVLGNIQLFSNVVIAPAGYNISLPFNSHLTPTNIEIEPSDYTVEIKNDGTGTVVLKQCAARSPLILTGGSGKIDTVSVAIIETGVSINANANADNVIYSRNAYLLSGTVGNYVIKQGEPDVIDTPPSATISAIYPLSGLQDVSALVTVLNRVTSRYDGSASIRNYLRLDFNDTQYQGYSAFKDVSYQDYVLIDRSDDFDMTNMTISNYTVYDGAVAHDLKTNENFFILAEDASHNLYLFEWFNNAVHGTVYSDTDRYTQYTWLASIQICELDQQSENTVAYAYPDTNDTPNWTGTISLNVRDNEVVRYD